MQDKDAYEDSHADASVSPPPSVAGAATQPKCRLLLQFSSLTLSALKFLINSTESCREIVPMPMTRR